MANILKKVQERLGSKGKTNKFDKWGGQGGCCDYFKVFLGQGD